MSIFAQAIDTNINNMTKTIGAKSLTFILVNLNFFISEHLFLEIFIDMFVIRA